MLPLLPALPSLKTNFFNNEMKMNNLYKTPPFSIKKSRKVNSNTHNFEISLTNEFVNELMPIIVPFLQDIVNSVNNKIEKSSSNRKYLESLIDKNKRLNLIALKCLRKCRKKRLGIEDIANKIGLTYNLERSMVIQSYYSMEERRNRKIKSFRNKKIVQMHREGASIEKIKKDLISTAILQNVLG